MEGAIFTGLLFVALAIYCGLNDIAKSIAAAKENK